MKWGQIWLKVINHFFYYFRVCARIWFCLIKIPQKQHVEIRYNKQMRIRSTKITNLYRKTLFLYVFADIIRIRFGCIRSSSRMQEIVEKNVKPKIKD